MQKKKAIKILMNIIFRWKYINNINIQKNKKCSVYLNRINNNDSLLASVLHLIKITSFSWDERLHAEGEVVITEWQHMVSNKIYSGTSDRHRLSIYSHSEKQCNP
jgi:hypothetical protein